MFKVTVKSSFCAAVIIPGFEGPCSQLHGYTYGVELVVTGAELDQTGVLIDYCQVRHELDNLLSKLDHKHLNLIPPFDTLPPTAENIAQWICQTLQLSLPEPTRIIEVSLSSSPNNIVTYCVDS